MSGLRLRRRPIQQLIQDMDAFAKVVDEVKEEKRTTGGFISALSFAIIFVLVVGELRDYYFADKEFTYRFTVDTEFNQSLSLDVDMVVAMPCDSIGADISGTVETNSPLQNSLAQDPTRFEFTEAEANYWDALKNAHRAQFRPGRRQYKTLDQVSYVRRGIVKGLEAEAEQKQREEAAKISAQPQSENQMGGVMLVIANGVGVFQLLSSSSGGAKGTACRIHGSVAIDKVAGGLHIGTGKALNIPGGGHAHLPAFGSDRNSNFSHRIERFTFGKSAEKIVGLVTPLASTEQISIHQLDLYQYYISIVPTKIFNSGPFDINSFTWTYQYAVTQRKRTIDHSQGSHGTPGITIKYDFAPMVIEVSEQGQSFIQVSVRLCAIVGGVFATSAIVNGLISILLASIIDRHQSRQTVTVSTINDHKHHHHHPASNDSSSETTKLTLGVIVDT